MKIDIVDDTHNGNKSYNNVQYFNCKLQQSKQKFKFKIRNPFLALNLQFTLLDAKLGAFHFQSLDIHFQSLNGPLHIE
jgi:hypothetical protein